MKRQRLVTLHLGHSKGCGATSTNNRTIGRLSRHKWLRQHPCYVLNRSVNGASKIVGLPSWIIKGLSDDIDP